METSTNERKLRRIQSWMIRSNEETNVVSAAATIPSTRVLGIVAAALTTKVKKEGSVTYVRNPRRMPCNT